MQDYLISEFQAYMKDNKVKQNNLKNKIEIL